MNGKTDTAKASPWVLILTPLYLLVYPALLLLLSGDWYWIEGWIFSVIFCGLSYAILVYLYVNDPALLKERYGSPFQKGQKLWDKIFLSMFMLLFVIWFVIMPLDAKRYGWSPEFPFWIKAVAIPLLILAFGILFEAMRENTFAATVVKIQEERNQKVVSTGLYGIIRHPMYAGGTLLFIGPPLLLGSVYGLLIGFLMTILMAVRSIGEEKMLKQELDGYEEYMRTVKWRLIPHIF